MNLKPLMPKSIMRFSILFLLVFTFILSACSPTTSETTRQVSINDVQVTVAPATLEPYIFITSEPNTITIHGVLIVLDPMTIIPAPNDSIFLAPLPVDQPISAIPQFEEGTVPQAEVDESTGEFVFTNIQPGQYAVVVITKGGAQIPTRYQESSSYAIFTLDDSQKDTTFDLGKLTLP
jgi:hypothetical protein